MILLLQLVARGLVGPRVPLARNCASRRLPLYLLVCWVLPCVAGCGPTTISSGTISLSEIRDGKDNTVIAVELKPEHQVPWTKPEDIRFDDGFPDLAADGPLAGRPHFMLADGGIVALPIQEGLDRQRFRGMFTIAGGEPLTRDQVLSNDTFYPPGHELPPIDFGATAEQAEAYVHDRIRRSNAFKRLAQALHEYHQANGHFPPAIIYGEDGRPWHSWRVLILPFLGEVEKKLHARYDFRVPWDDARNLPVLEQIPSVFRGAPGTGAQTGSTPFVLITGPGTAFPLAESGGPDGASPERG